MNFRKQITPQNIAAFTLPIFSFCQIKHYPPIPSFYHEWAAYLAASLLLLISSLLELKTRAQPENKLTLTALLLLSIAALTLFQAFFGLLTYPTSSLTLTALILLAAALGGVGSRWRHHQNHDAINALLAGLVAAASINTLAAIFQFNGFFIDGLSFINLPPPPRADGLLGQPNHFGMLCTLAIFCTWWLWRKNSGSLLVWSSFFVLLSWGLISSSSRTALLSICLGWFFLLSISHRTKNIKQNKVLIRAALLFLVTAASQYYLAVLTEKENPLRTTGASNRTQLYQSVVDLTPNLPFTGYGFGTYQWLRIVDSTAGLNDLTSTHTHNLFLQLLVEWGAPGLMIGLILFGSWAALAIKSWKRGDDTSRLAIIISGGIGIHSMLEFPLWYSYFLFPYVIFMALAGDYTFNLRSDRLSQWLKPAAWIAFGALGVIAGMDYLRTQDITLGGIRQELQGNMQIRLPQDEINRIAALTLFQGEADINLARTFEPDPFFLDMKMHVVEQVARYRPNAETLSRLILFQAYTGQDEKAKKLLFRLKTAGLGHYEKVIDILRLYAQQYPGTLDDLLLHLNEKEYAEG